MYYSSRKISFFQPTPSWEHELRRYYVASMELVLPHPCVTVGVVLGAERSLIPDLIREELSLHAFLVTGEQRDFW